MHFWYCKCLLWRGAVLAINGALGKKEGGGVCGCRKNTPLTFNASDQAIAIGRPTATWKMNSLALQFTFFMEIA